VADHIVSCEHLNDFKPQDLSTIVWSYAKAEISHLDLFTRIGDHLVTLTHLHDFNSQALANTIYAYAKAEVSHQGLFGKVADHIMLLDNLDDYTEQNVSNLAWSYHKAGIIRQDLNDKLIGLAMDRKFSTKRLEKLDRWTSEDTIENLEGNEHNGGGSVVALEDDNNESNMEDGGLEDDDPDVSTPEDLSLLTVVQLKDRLRKLGLRVSGRKHELISRLNNHFKVQDGSDE